MRGAVTKRGDVTKEFRAASGRLLVPTEQEGIDIVVNGKCISVSLVLAILAEKLCMAFVLVRLVVKVGRSVTVS